MPAFSFVHSTQPPGRHHQSKHIANWRFQGIVKGLPWKPLLAAAGATTHVIDPDRGVVVEHQERWKANPGEVVARLLRPARTPPGTAWETFMVGCCWGLALGHC